MGSRGTIHRSSLRRVAGLLAAKPGALRRPVSSATYADKAEIERLDDTSNARIIRVDSSAVTPDRQSGGKPEPGDRDGYYLLVADLGGQP